MESPTITNITEKSGVLRFEIENVNVSIINAMRRTVLSNIETAVFKTFPYEENLAVIHSNTTRFNNEFLKQRLGCIPIHIKDMSILDNYYIELNIQNDTDEIVPVTTKHFRVKHIKNDKYVSEKERDKIFPPDPLSKEHILFAKLNPYISKDSLGEKIHLTCKLTKGTAKENGMFNVVSTCSFKYAEDEEAQDAAWKKIERGKTEYDRENWYNHDAKRIFKENAFEFIIETIGVFSNLEILQKAINIIIQKIQTFKKGNFNTKNSNSTMYNSYDIKLKNEDYTLGKIIEYILHEQYFKLDKKLSFIGFNKLHPHDDFSIIRVAFANKTEKKELEDILQKSCDIGEKIFESILGQLKL